jgi:hypothetical protein
MSMRHSRCLIALGAALALSLLPGCLPSFMRNTNNTQTKDPRTVPDTEATPESLVNYLNQNAQKVNSLRASLAADVSSPDGAIELGGFLACEKPRGFRLKASAFGSPAVDAGSNNEEFWFWAKEQRGAAPLMFCSYRDLATGKVQVPFPFQPDMVLVALGMAAYDKEVKGYTLKDNKEKLTLELTLDTKGLDGKPITRTVVFNRNKARAGAPQVLSHVLRDDKGKVICQADVLAVRDDPVLKVKVPTKVKIAWPTAKASITLMLSSVEVNKLTREDTASMFTRATIPGAKLVDLASWRPSGSSMARRGK